MALHDITDLAYLVPRYSPLANLQLFSLCVGPAHINSWRC